MYKLFFIQTLLFCSFYTKSVFSQNLSVVWIQYSKGTDWKLVDDFTIDHQGNIILVGNSHASETNENLYFENEEIFVNCFDGDGQLKWENIIQKSGYCHVTSVTATENNGFFLSGFYKGKMSLGTFNLNSGNEFCAFVCRFERNGKVKWVKPIGGNFHRNGIVLCPFKDNGIVWAGSFNGNLEIIDSVFSNAHGAEGIFLTLIDNNGNFRDFNHIRGSGNVKVNDLKCDENNIYLALSFEKEIRINNYTLISHGRKDGAVIALNQEMNPQMVRQIGGAYDDDISGLDLDDDHNIYIAGNYSSEFKIDNEIFPQTAGNQDAFVCKMDQTGRILWYDGFGSEANDYVTSMAVNKDNSVYLCGNSRGSISKNSCQADSKMFSNDVFIARYNQKGKLAFIQTMGDTLVDFASNLKADFENNIFLAGNLAGPFNTSNNPAKNRIENRFFIARLTDKNFTQEKEISNDSSWNSGAPFKCNLTSDKTSASNVNFTDVEKEISGQPVFFDGFNALVYPNPFQDNCFLRICSSSGIDELKFHLLNIQGVKLWEADVKIHNDYEDIEIRLDAYPPGNYELLILEKEKVMFRQILIKQ